ncbi:hypothetical protein ACQHIV_20200 [Kribbella sp. GL6]|uniref:hypothetical protein n=1 Tax=Kribbella sp. GL6 TaxID=3419765 RepID=UPI003CFCC773
MGHLVRMVDVGPRYERIWRAAVGLLATIGVLTALVFVSPSTNLAAFLVAAFTIGAVCLSVGLGRDLPNADLLRTVPRGAVLGALCVLAICGYAAAVGARTVMLILLVLGVSPPVVTWLRATPPKTEPAWTNPNRANTNPTGSGRTGLGAAGFGSAGSGSAGSGGVGSGRRGAGRAGSGRGEPGGGSTRSGWFARARNRGRDRGASGGAGAAWGIDRGDRAGDSPWGPLDFGDGSGDPSDPERAAGFGNPGDPECGAGFGNLGDQERGAGSGMPGEGERGAGLGSLGDGEGGVGFGAGRRGRGDRGGRFGWGRRRRRGEKKLLSAPFLQEELPLPKYLTAVVRSVGELTDEELCLAWRRSFTQLERAVRPDHRQAMVDVRRAYLDELERRHPESFTSWLASNPRAAGNPARFFTHRADH